MKGQRNLRLRKRPAKGGAKTELINFLKPISCKMQLLSPTNPKIPRTHRKSDKVMKKSCIIDIICISHHFGALPSFGKNFVKILIFRPQNWPPIFKKHHFFLLFCSLESTEIWPSQNFDFSSRKFFCDLSFSRIDAPYCPLSPL